MKNTFTVTAYPFGQKMTSEFESLREVHNFLDAWLSLHAPGSTGDIEIRFRKGERRRE